MELLARQCKLKDLAKNRDGIKVIEAILFGLSGMLDSTYKDEYPIELKQEFSFYQRKYDLKPINPVAWKFSKMRPSNFPTIRIAQLADIIHKNHFLFRAFIEATEMEEINNLLQCQASSYWDNHYRFDKESPRNHPKKLSKTWIEMLVINVVSPLLFVYGNHIGNQDVKDKAVSFLEYIPPEKNSIINRWHELGIGCKNALQSQGAIRLKQVYCNNTRCMSCGIGNELIKS